jgi:hypothetical protein
LIGGPRSFGGLSEPQNQKMLMKKIILPFLAVVAFVILSGCGTDGTHSSTTTTQQTTTPAPVTTTTTDTTTK